MVRDRVRVRIRGRGARGHALLGVEAFGHAKVSELQVAVHAHLVGVRAQG